MSKNKNTTVTISTELKEKLDTLKGEKTTYNDLIQYLIEVATPRIETRGLGKAERLLLDWLHLGTDKRITPSELRFMSGVHLDGCKAVIELYQNEVDQFNEQFKK